MNKIKKIAVIGSGIAGHVATYRLKDYFDVSLFEQDDRFGGHANTVDIIKDDNVTPVDTGFIVYNELTYPGLTNLLKELQVNSIATDMSFGASLSLHNLEYSSKSINSLFAQRKNLFNFSYLGIWKDFFRFRKEAKEYILKHPNDHETTLGEFIHTKGYGKAFRDSFLYAVAGAIWSTAPKDMDDFPLQSFLRFMINHKMLDPWGQPVWRTIPGGSRKYVEAIINKGGYKKHPHHKVTSILREKKGIKIICDNHYQEIFDEVVVATHSDQALKLLTTPSYKEQEILGSIKYQKNTAILHSDENLMPKEKNAWAAWNVYIGKNNTDQVELSYDMNLLQNIKNGRWIVTLNNNREINEGLIHKTIQYQHPFFDISALKAQKRWEEISGIDHVHYCGAYWKWGFHEDGLWSAIRVVENLKNKYIHELKGV